MVSLDKFAAEKLDRAAAQSLLRTLPPANMAGLNFSSNDYLGLSGDPRLAEAAANAARALGTGAGASRLVTGNHAGYAACEAAIAALKSTEAALVFGAGYLANIGTIPAVVSEGDLILLDELSHACMISGARLSGASIHSFRHNDVGHLQGLLARERGRHRNCLVMTEGVFSMDGDLAPLGDIHAVARDHDAWLMTDDAHGLGVVGQGRGSAHAAGIKPDIQMGTFSKAVGSYGGYVAASAAVISMLVNRARSLIFSTGLPPAVVAASTAGLDIIARDPGLCARPLALARLFCARADLAPAQSAIVPVVLGDAAAALAASDMLAREGFLVRAIRPPTVPEGTARLRVTFTATHVEDDVLRLADLVRNKLHVRRGKI
jgi:8-amino-7-oxononanoate synthase